MDVAPRALPGAFPIGREAEATRLAHLIDDTVAGAKRAVVLLGAPGIGKTTLLRWMREASESGGCLTVSVRVPAAAGLPPLYPLGQVIDGLAAACRRRGATVSERVERLLGALTGTSSSDAYATGVPQLADALEALGHVGPPAVFIDDYHWAPPDGVEMLLAAFRVVETPVCFVASARLRGFGDGAVAPLPEPTADLWVEHLEVRGLEPSAVAQLANMVLGGEALPSLIDALYARTFGNPLFIVETLKGWVADGALASTGGFWGLDQDGAPSQARSLKEMIVTRLGRLEAGALAVARSLAAIGRDADFDELGAICGIEPTRLVGMLRRLIDEGVVGSDAHLGAKYRLAHPLYEAALLDDEGSPERSLLHGKIFAELRRRSAAGRKVSAAELAHHAVRALTPPADLRQVLTSAAEEAEASGSFEEAAGWYGHLAEQADDPRQLVRALRGQASAASQLDPQRAIALFTYALELENESDGRALLLFGRAKAYRVMGDPESALADLDEALPLTEPGQVFDVRHAMGALNGMLRRVDDAERIFQSLAEESAGSPDHTKALGHLGMVALIRGSVAEGTRLMEAALEICSDEAYASYLRGNLGWLLGLLGRWDEAEKMIEETLASAVSSGDIYSECSLCSLGGRLAGWRGDLARAFDKGTRAHRLATRLGNPADVIAASDTLATALIENGMAEEAAAMLSDILVLDGPGTEEREMTYSYTVFAQACLLAGQPDRARTALDRARAHLPGAPFWAVAIDRCEAQLDLVSGDPHTALGRLRRWLEYPSEIALEQAAVHDLAAQTFLALGDRREASTRAAEALARYEQIGAVRMASRVAGWLDSIRVPKRGRPRSVLPGRLTEREAEILRLVVLGRSNQGVAEELVISPATVKKHLENIMAKAGVSRRTELVPFAITLGMLAAEELVAERQAARERAEAKPLTARPGRSSPLAPRAVRPNRDKEADPYASERSGG